MKVALLLSGLPRAVENGYLSSWKNIIDNYDTDIYIHTWKDNTWGSNWEDILKIYGSLSQTKSILIQSPFKFTEYKNGINLPHTDKSRPLPEYDVISCYRQLPMFYSWQKVYQNYKDTTVNYDCVIRSRYDLKFDHNVELENLNLNYLNHAPGGGYFDDNLCISNKENMDRILNSIFDNLISHSRITGVLPSAEQSWTSLIDRSGCPTKIDPILRFTLLRENHLWWGE